jgi:hypothetical protein
MSVPQISHPYKTYGQINVISRGGSSGGGGGAHPAHAPLKLEKIWFFGVKSWFFTRNTPTIFAFPSTRRNFFKCTPLTWNPGSAPDKVLTDGSVVFKSLYSLKVVIRALLCSCVFASVNSPEADIIIPRHL